MKLVRLTDSRFHVALAKLAAQPMPLRAAFKLKGINAKVKDEAQKFEEVRQSALERYGKKGEDGKLALNEDQTVQFEPGQLQAFAKELSELGDTEVEVGTLSLAELGEKVILSTDDVMSLEGILVE